MKPEQTTINTRLRIIRKEKNFSGEAFGELLGLSKTGLSNIENDRARVSTEQIQIILEKFEDINPDWFILNKGEVYRPTAKAGANSGACWDELEKEQKRYEQLLQDYKQLQNRVKEQEAGE